MSELQKKIVTPVPLSQVTNGIDLSWENGVIQRKNGQRSIQAQCEPAPDVSPEEARLSIKDAIEEIELPIGYKMEWMGEYDMQQRALINVFNLLPLAGVLIIFILVMLFNDYKKPLIILLCLPIVFIGIVPVLILSKQPFSFTAIVGTIGMAGMLIKNSIVLLEEIEHLINSKIPYTAVVEAAISRATCNDGFNNHRIRRYSPITIYVWPLATITRDYWLVHSSLCVSADILRSFIASKKVTKL